MLTSRKLYINLPVKDLERSKAFFATLGFAFNPQITNTQAACLVLNSEAYVMLLPEPFFQTFTRHAICDTATHTECLLAVNCESRAEVDFLVNTAIAAGGTRAQPPNDHGFMYGWSFYDPDGHHWEVLWMDPNHR